MRNIHTDRSSIIMSWI